MKVFIVSCLFLFNNGETLDVVTTVRAHSFEDVKTVLKENKNKIMQAVITKILDSGVRDIKITAREVIVAPSTGAEDLVH